MVLKHYSSKDADLSFTKGVCALPPFSKLFSKEPWTALFRHRRLLSIRLYEVRAVIQKKILKTIQMPVVTGLYIDIDKSLKYVYILLF